MRVFAVSQPAVSSGVEEFQGDVKVAPKQECRGRPPEAFARGDIQTTNELRSGFAQVV